MIFISGSKDVPSVTRPLLGRVYAGIVLTFSSEVIPITFGTF